MPANGNRAAWPSSDDFTFLSLAVILIGAGFFGWLAWTEYHATISAGIAVLVHRQIVLIRHFTPALDQLDVMVQTADPATVKFTDIVSVLNATGQYLRIPAIAVISALALICFLRSAPSRFTRSLDLDGLMAEQAQSFRSIAAFVGRHLKLVPLDAKRVRPADPALHASEWVARFASQADGSLDLDAARRAFATQLGRPWRGLKDAPVPVRVMFAVFSLHLAQKRVEAQALLGDLAESLPRGGSRETAGPAKPYQFPRELGTRADDILRADDVRAAAEAITGRHAFTAPALMSLLTEARRRAGVLAPAQFAGLKLVDRSLWYALHSLGFEGDGPGQTSHPNPRVEAAGARDHWAAERSLGRPIVTPNVERAVNAIRAAVGHDDPNNSTSRVS